MNESIQDAAAVVKILQEARRNRAISAIKFAAGGLAKFMCRKKKEQMEALALMKKPSLHAATDLSKIRSNLRQVSACPHIIRSSLPSCHGTKRRKALQRSVISLQLPIVFQPDQGVCLLVGAIGMLITMTDHRSCQSDM